MQTWGYYYGDNLFFTSPNDGFNITASNHFGTVISDLISPQTFPKKKLKKQNHSIPVFPKQAKNKLFIKDNSKKYTASVSIIDTNGKLIKKHAVAIDKKRTSILLIFLKEIIFYKFKNRQVKHFLFLFRNTKANLVNNTLFIKTLLEYRKLNPNKKIFVIFKQ